MIERTVIVAPMHLLANQWLSKNTEHRPAIVFTKPSSLRGLPPHTKIIVIDSTISFTDSRGMQKALERFSDVLHVPA